MFVPDPTILTQPNIPKPLHGLNPRTLKGSRWWDETRKAAYSSTEYRCSACGIHKSEARGPKHLEAHEYWNIDYTQGIGTVEKIVPLCHYCHNFIHSGRLNVLAGREKSVQEVINILEHGFRILKENNLKAFYGTVGVANSLGARTFGVEGYAIPEGPSVPWDEWRLILDGQEYKSRFSSKEDWQNNYR